MKNYNERTCSFCKQEFETITVKNIVCEEHGLAHRTCSEAWEKIRYLNAKDTIKHINSIDSMEYLQTVITLERNADTRKTVLDAATNRLLKLEGYTK